MCRERLITWYSICNVSRCTPNNLALTSKTPTASDGEISKMTFLNLQRDEERKRTSGQLWYSIPSHSATGHNLRQEEDVMASGWRYSLVRLQLIYGDQHALLVEARCRVLLRHLLAFPGLVVAGFLWQPAGGDRDTCASLLQSWRGRGEVTMKATNARCCDSNKFDKCSLLQQACQFVPSSTTVLLSTCERGADDIFWHC